MNNYRKPKKGITPEYLIKKTLEIIDKHNCMFILDILPHIGVCKQTFYKHGVHRDEEVLEKLANNKIATKQNLRKKWTDSDNATLQIALYKLIGSREERLVLTNNSTVTINQDDINKQFTQLADIMDAVNKPSGDKSDNTDTE